jgi:hypothetical protein
MQLHPRHPSFGAQSLLITVLCCAPGATGCLRFGYDALRESSTSKRDAGIDAGSGTGGAAPRGGRDGGGAGKAGNAGAGASALDSGSQDANAGEGGDGEAGAHASEAGVIDIPSDAGSDAGVIDVPTDAGADAGAADAPLCPERMDALFCDGFEDPGFSRWQYTEAHNGMLTRSTVRAHSGPTSLYATTGPPAQGTEARWATTVLDHQKSGDAWMRFYDWVPNSVVVTEHFSVGVMSEIAVPYAGFELRILPASVDINSTSGVYPGTVVFPRERWVCVEMHVVISANAGVLEAYLDGVLAVTSGPTLVNTLPADGYTAAEIGVHFAGPNQGPVEVYVDDVVVGRTRIPCD